MSRARNIKPGFYKNEDLAECSVLARLLFPGLWMLADRDGRLEDRPKRIKGEIFPFDCVEVEPLLVELSTWKFIIRYEKNGAKYIQVVNFSKHQRPHCREKESEIPPPDGYKATEISEHDQEEEMPRHDLGSALEQPRACSARSDSLIPDSLIPDSLIPDSLIPDSLIPESLIPESNTSAAGSPGVDARPDPTEKPAAVAAVCFDAAEFLIENGAEPQTAADYLTLRKTKKAASTRTALRSVVAESGRAGLPVQTTLETCCSRGWVGFKAEWVEQKARDGPRQTLHEQRKNTLDELTGRNRHDQNTDPRDITAEVIRIA